MTSLDPGVWPKLWTALGKLVISSGGLEETVRCAVLNMMGGPHWRRTELVVDGYSSRKVHKAKRGMELVSQELTPGEIDNVTAEISRVELEGDDLIIELQDFGLAEEGNSLDLAPWSRQPPPPTQNTGASARTD